MTTATLAEVTIALSDQTNFNNVHTAIAGDVVPRNASAVATDKAGDLGTELYQWKTGHVVVGYVPTGTIMPFYDFGGTLATPQGWMVCDGSLVSSTTYDSQHASGDWVEYVGSSEFEGLYLPSMNNKFVSGTSGATEAGTTPLADVGNAASSLNLAHTHGSPLTSATNNSLVGANDPGGPGSVVRSASPFTHDHSVTLASALTNFDVTPVSIDFKILIKVVG